jgi:hypothetical protein
MGGLASKTNRFLLASYDGLGWKADAVKVAVSEGKLAPVTVGSSESSRRNTIFCELCYEYHPIINQTKCCHHHICSSCATFVTGERGASQCPFCRKSNLELNANMMPEDVLNPEGKDAPEYLELTQKIEARRTDSGIENSALHYSH